MKNLNKTLLTLAIMAMTLPLHVMGQRAATTDGGAPQTAARALRTARQHSPAGRLTGHVMECAGMTGIRDSRTAAVRKVLRRSDGIMTDTPAGELEVYYGSSMGYYVDFGQATSYEDDGRAVSVVTAADGKVYIKNPFSGAVTDSWLEGTLEGDTIVVHTPQMIYDEKYSDGSVETYHAVKMTQNEGGYSYVVAEGDMDLKFVCKDGTITLVPDDPDAPENTMLGMTDNFGRWTGYGDYSITLMRQTDRMVTLPADARPERYEMRYGYYGDGHVMDVAFSGSDVYVALTPRLDGAWIRGTLSGDSVTFSSLQYMGVDTVRGYHIYLLGTEDEESAWQGKVKREFKLHYDAATRVLQGDEGILLNCGRSIPYYIEEFYGPELRPRPEGIADAAPADPEILELMMMLQEDASGNVVDLGYGHVVFDLPPYDVNGNMYDVTRLHYNIYLDGQPYTLTPDDYRFVRTPMTDIPYLFQDEYDITLYGMSHDVYIFRSDFKVLGIQATLTGDDGIGRKSGMVTYERYDYEDDAIGGVKAGASAVVSVTYTDMAGRRITQPAAGQLYIRTVTHSDGTVSRAKGYYF